MIMRELRQERDWSQEQLAELSGLSLRTIQRLEGINKVSTETVQALATTFDMGVFELEQELAMEKTSSTWKRRPARAPQTTKRIPRIMHTSSTFRCCCLSI